MKHIPKPEVFMKNVCVLQQNVEATAKFQFHNSNKIPQAAPPGQPQAATGK